MGPSWKPNMYYAVFLYSNVELPEKIKSWQLVIYKTEQAIASVNFKEMGQNKAA